MTECKLVASLGRPNCRSVQSTEDQTDAFRAGLLEKR